MMQNNGEQPPEWSWNPEGHQSADIPETSSAGTGADSLTSPQHQDLPVTGQQVPPARPAPQYGQYADPTAPGTGKPGSDGWGFGATNDGSPGQGGYPQGPGSSWMAAVPKPGIIPLAPLKIGELLSGTFAAIRTNPGPLFGFAFVVTAIVVPVVLVSSYFFGGNWGEFLINPESVLNSNPTSDEFAAEMGQILASALTVYAVQIVLMFFASTLVSGLVTVAVSQATIGRAPTIGQCWEMAKGRMLSLLGTTVLTGLISLVPAAILTGLGVGLIYAADGATNNESAFIVTAILVTLVLSAINLAISLFLSTRLALVAMPAVLEEVSPIEAIRRSWQLTKGAFWVTLGRILLIGMLVGIIAGTIGGLISTIVSAVMFVAAPDWAFAASQAISMFSSGIALPITAAFTVLMYIDRRIRTEGLAPSLLAASEMD